MKINTQLAEALNKQVNVELTASYNYLAMAAYFDSVGLGGFAKWFRGQSTEETQHAMRLYDFIVARDGRVSLDSMAQPAMEFASPIEAVKAALAMEGEVTAQIHALFELAHEVKEYATQSMLNWFLEEQVEEEDGFRSLLDRTEAAAESRWFLLQLDKELGATTASHA